MAGRGNAAFCSRNGCLGVFRVSPKKLLPLWGSPLYAQVRSGRFLSSPFPMGMANARNIRRSIAVQPSPVRLVVSVVFVSLSGGVNGRVSPMLEVVYGAVSRELHHDFIMKGE